MSDRPTALTDPATENGKKYTPSLSKDPYREQRVPAISPPLCLPLHPRPRIREARDPSARGKPAKRQDGRKAMDTKRLLCSALKHSLPYAASPRLGRHTLPLSHLFTPHGLPTVPNRCHGKGGMVMTWEDAIMMIQLSVCPSPPLFPGMILLPNHSAIHTTTPLLSR